VVAGCGGQVQPTVAEEGSDLVRARYTVTVVEDGQSHRQEYEVIADGDRRLRFAFVGGGEGDRDQRRGSWTVWDGHVLITYDPASEPAYNRIEEPEAGQRPTFVLVEGSADFVRACPDARRLRTHALLGRTAVRYACGASSGQDPPMEAHEMSLDQETGLLLEQAGGSVSVVATEVELDPTVAADTFATGLPADSDESTGAKVDEVRLPRVGGGELALADYPAPLVIVAGDPAGIRKMVNRLAALTNGGVQPRVIGMLIVIPSPDWEGSLLDAKDAASFAEEASKAAGTFPVPVAVDIKGAAAYQITQAAGVDAGQTSPTSIGFVSSNRTLVGATTDAVTDDELRQRISSLR